MAIQRRSLSQIRDEIYRICGNYDTSGTGTDTPWRSDANLYRIINDYLQRLPYHAAQVVQKGAPRRPIRFDMYKTVLDSGGGVGAGQFVTDLGVSLVYFPTDLDEVISLYDRVSNEPIHAIQEVARWHKDLKERAPGPPEFYEHLGFVSDSGSVWRRYARLYPATEAARTPDLELTYWRLPARMAGSAPTTEFPDIDPKYEMLAIIGPSRAILQPNDPSFDRIDRDEKELLLDLVMSGRA